jgi:hypothetical protein
MTGFVWEAREAIRANAFFLICKAGAGEDRQGRKAGMAGPGKRQTLIGKPSSLQCERESEAGKNTLATGSCWLEDNGDVAHLGFLVCCAGGVLFGALFCLRNHLNVRVVFGNERLRRRVRML